MRFSLNRPGNACGGGWGEGGLKNSPKRGWESGAKKKKKKKKKKNGPFPEVKSSSWLLILSDFLKDFLADETIEQDSNVWPRSTEVAS